MESRHLAVMMTDIQGFTKRTSGLGRDAVEKLLALHERLLVPVFKEYDGTVVKGLGDAFLVTFESPTRAVQAGVAVQKALAEHNRKAEPGADMRVRVAINAGEVNLRGGDVFGEAVNITSRVEGVAAAEQVTLTEAVHLLMDRASIKTEFLEAVELKGIPFPVKLYRVAPDWLEPEKRGLELAKASEPPPATPGGSRGKLLAGAVLAAALVGAWAARPPDPVAELEEAARSGETGAVLARLEDAARREPSARLEEFAARWAPDRLAALEREGRHREALDLVGRLAGLYPSLPGLTEPKAQRARKLATLAALRAKGEFEAGAPLLAELAAAPGEERAVLARYAEEDLRRAWAEALGRPEAQGDGLAVVLARPELVRCVGALRELERESAFLGYVHGFSVTVQSAALAGTYRSNDPVERAMRDFAAALTREPELRERAEALPVFRVLLAYYQPEDDPWKWLDQLVAQKVGAWIEPHLARWVDEAPPADAGLEARLANLALRRNAERLARRRGLKVIPAPGVAVPADLALLRLRPSRFGQDRMLEEFQRLALAVASAPEAERPGLDARLKELLAWGLADDEETMTWRETLVAIARSRGFKELDQPGRELFRDLQWGLVRVPNSGWEWKITDWHREFLKQRFAACEKGVESPWREAIEKLLADAEDLLKEKAADLLGPMSAARRALQPR